MAIVMTKDGLVRPLELADLTEVAERDKRIAQLEALNATLAAQIDRQAKVVKAAQCFYSCATIKLNGCPACCRMMINAVDAYKQQMAALAKGAGR